MSFFLLNRCVNPWVRWLLRSPFRALARRSLLLLEYTGKKSGRRHSLPVQYAEYEGEIVILVGSPEQKRWWRNLSPAAPVRILRCGRWMEARARVLEAEEEAVAPRLERYFDRFPSAARYHGIGRDANGNLDRASLLELASRAVLVVLS